MEEKNKATREVQDEVLEFGGIFSNNVEDMKAKDVATEFTGDENVYNVSLKNENVVDGKYKAVGRFVPNPRNTADKIQNIIAKYMYFLPNPDNPESKLVVDCPSNLGIRDNIITSAFFHCKNSGSPSMIQLGKDNFSRRQYWFTLYQIIKDSQQQDLEGQIKVFRFANQVNKKIESITSGDKSLDIEPVPYSNPFLGRDFILQIEEKEITDEKSKRKRNITSYEESRFKDKSSILIVPDTKIKVAQSKAYAKEIYDYLLNNSPDLSNYEAQQWSKQLEEQVIESVRMTLEDERAFDKIYRKIYKKPYVFSSVGTRDNEAGKLNVDLEEAENLEEVDTKKKSESPKESPASAKETVYEDAPDLPSDLDDDEEFVMK